MRGKDFFTRKKKKKKAHFHGYKMMSILGASKPQHEDFFSTLSKKDKAILIRKAVQACRTESIF